MTDEAYGSRRFHAALAAADARPLEQPKRLGSFFCHAEIAAGGQGTVWLATGDAAALSRPCVIKEFSDADAVTLTRAQRSVRLQLKLLDAAATWSSRDRREDDPARPTRWVPDLLAWDLEPPVAWVAQDFRGPNLRTHLKRSAGHHDPDALLDEVAYALTFVHAVGAVHRDLKPDNILVEQVKRRHDLYEEVVLCDFDLSKGQDQTTLTHSAAVGGTPGYSAPEQLWLSARDVTKAADIYSFAAVTVFVYTGLEPQDFLRGQHPWDLALSPGVAERLGFRRPWVEQALSPLPAERPSLDELGWLRHQANRHS